MKAVIEVKKTSSVVREVVLAIAIETEVIMIVKNHN